MVPGCDRLARIVPGMKYTIACSGCGAKVEIDAALGIRTSRETDFTTAPGRVTISEGRRVVHQCAQQTDD
jgi:hypothetical protein